MKNQMISKLIYFLSSLLLQIFFLYLTYSISLRLYRVFFHSAYSLLELYSFILGIFIIVYKFLMWIELYSHGYHFYLKLSSSIVLKNLLIATFFTFIGLISYELLGLNKNIVFWKIAIFISFGIIMLYIFHLLQYLCIYRMAIKGYFYKKVAYVGKPSPRVRLYEFFQDAGETKEFIGTLAHENGSWTLKNGSAELRFYSLERAILENKIGEIILFLGKDLSSNEIEHITQFCKKNGIGYYVVPDLSLLPKSSYWDKLFSYIPIIARHTTARDELFSIIIKRVFDVLISSMVLLTLLPILLIIIVLILIDDWHNPFYVSTRIGKDGNPLSFYKFRTMHPQAEQHKDKLKHLNERMGTGPLFKIKRDPRVTKIGRFLRHTSLDEIPQFVNVLKGELSIIGPRPHLPEEVKNYSGKDFLRLECMPGISCLPQINDRNHLSFNKWIELDLEYRANWSLKQDFYILKETTKIFFCSFFQHE